MHELSVVTALLDACRTEIARHGGGVLRTVTVAVGELAGVDPTLLEHAWPLATAETPEEGAELRIEWRAARQRCPQCGEVQERQPGTWLRLCPHCASPLAIVDGSELDIVGLTFAPPSEGEPGATIREGAHHGTAR